MFEISKAIYEFSRKAFFLVWSFMISVFIYSFIAFIKKTIDTKSKQSREFLVKLNGLQKRLLFFATVILFSLLFLMVDIYVIRLPSPVIPYIFILLAATIIFDTITAVVFGIIFLFINDYYLFFPHFKFFHALSFAVSFFGLVLSIVAGRKIKKYINEIKDMNAQLQNVMTARNKFTSAAAHDIRSSLSILNLNNSLIAKEYANVATDVLETNEREIEKIGTLLTTILEFLSLQAEKYLLNIEKFDLVQLCKERLETLKGLYADHDFKLCYYHAHEMFINADKMVVNRIVTNILDNAAKYSPKNSRITLELDRDDEFYSIIIEDEGIGMTKGFLSKIFKPFEQVDPRKKGLGLGLYIVKSFIELHKGTIEVDSLVGKGTKFSIRMPIFGPYQ